jgi:CelD/BcsL family acetyltransferase involved in cellulose biosynthesis
MVIASTSEARRASGALRIEWLSDSIQMEAVEGAWRELEASVQNRTVFSTFDFLATWYRHYAGPYGGSPLVGLAWRGSRLAGVAPLTLRRGSIGRIPVMRVDFAPNDTPAGEFLIEDGQPDIAAELLDSLVRRAKFDVVCLNGFDVASPVLSELRSAAPMHRLAVELGDQAYAVVDLRSGYQNYHAGLSAHYRRNLNQKAKKIAAAGGGVVSGEEPFTDDASVTPTLDDSVTRMIAINEASYKLMGQRLADHHRAFLHEFAARFGPRGMLSLPILSIGGQDAAYILGLVERGCFYDITLAYAQAFEKLSPGAHLFHATLEALEKVGVHTVVSHGAHDYKKHWASAFVPQQRLFLFARGPRATATRFVRFRLLPLWRQLGAIDR